MCGILGHWNVSGIEESHWAVAMNQLKHRGPDERCEFASDEVRLGIQRLSIIDLTEGVQPVRSESGEVVAVMNGEIYNHVELAKGLRSRGYTLRSRTDAEVLPHLYEEHGDDFVNHLRGMFAIALWDNKKRKLILARDRFGKKPLYFWKPQKNSLAFASELKALKALAPNASWSLREQGVYDFLSLGCVPQPETLYRNVRQVPPSTVLTFDGEQIAERKIHSGEKPSVGSVQEHIRESVRIRLRSDVPVGVFLSGGVDSTIVAIEAAKEVGESLRTFTVKVDDPALDESKVAANTARELGVQHTVLPLAVSPREDLMSAITTSPLRIPAHCPAGRWRALLRNTSRWCSTVMAVTSFSQGIADISLLINWAVLDLSRNCFGKQWRHCPQATGGPVWDFSPALHAAPVPRGAGAISNGPTICFWKQTSNATGKAVPCVPQKIGWKRKWCRTSRRYASKCNWIAASIYSAIC